MTITELLADLEAKVKQLPRDWDTGQITLYVDPDHILALVAYVRNLTAWKRVADKQPAPHKRYTVRRNKLVFTATPCYGLHEPWWVLQTLYGEAAPSLMLSNDEWLAGHLDAGEEKG